MALRGPFTRWPRATDAVLAIVMYLETVFVVFEDPNQLSIRALGDVPIAAYIIPAVASGALYWHRYQPLVVLGVVMVASALLMGLGYLDVPLLGVAISLYINVGSLVTVQVSV